MDKAFVALPVEGRIATQEEIAEKASNGRYYVEDVWKITDEFPSHLNYDTSVDLEDAEGRLAAQCSGKGFTVLDVSHELAGVKHALQLATAWSEIVHRARNEKAVLLVRRTPANSGAMLMAQRLEHIRGRCSEFSPIAVAVFARDVQLLFNRDVLTDKTPEAFDAHIVDWVMERERILDESASAAEAPALVEGAEPDQAPPSMGRAAFARQRQSMQRLYEQLRVDKLPVDTAERVRDAAASIGELHL
tara:strand:- start:3185 stop:3925 length:741 start_codon:yes stop_codon:yes gene_type:complete